LGINSVAVAGSGNTTSAPSSLNLKTICGRVVPASSQVETLFTSSVTTLAPEGTAPAAATYAAFVFELPVVGCK